VTRLSDALSGITPPPRLPPPPQVEIPADYCGCHKPPGCWGNGGQHFRFYGPEDTNREIDAALAGLPEGSGDPAREHTERTTREWCAFYVGRHVAYEQCPAFYAVCKRQIEERKRTQKKAPRNADIIE